MINLSFVTNVITSLFCAAVLVQTVRLSHAVHKLRHAGLIEVVASLETATETSQRALGDLTRVLSAEGPPLDAAVRGARDLRAQLAGLRDELSLMIDVGNGVAERILAAANGARGAGGADGAAADDAVVPASPTPLHAADGRRDAGATTPPRVAGSRQAERKGRDGQGIAPAVVGASDAPSSIGEHGQSADGRRDLAGAPASAAAEEPQS
ncbi:hypothetical protein [Sphingomonas sp. BK580]|uniref:hypothetical protein n=1 Tax=Sphingomonas sp. BK580 TaxID=2586972 RepID=UPI001608E081|nr:hypothetical protein [Sphingomonas sp. BK580]MBB3692768.1 hypothetical protein [Sphingomonas sp. BK580]